MDEIKALEARITSALDRIGTALTEKGTAARLAAQLQEERFANQQLEERVRLLKSRQDGKLADLEVRVGEQAQHLATQDADMQRLRASNADLTELCAQLRRAAMVGVAEPELINRALVAEVEALNTQRATEAAEVEAILSNLKPLLQKEG